MIRRFRLFPYLLTVILLCSVAIFGSIILYDFTFCRDMLIRSQEDKYTTLLSISADQISYQLQIVEEAVGENLDFFVVAAPPDDQAAIKRMELILKSLPHLKSLGQIILFNNLIIHLLCMNAGFELTESF